jgi:hypothetical protein
MFPKEFLIAPHFYPIFQSKCCLPFTYIGEPKGSIFKLENKTFFFGELPEFHFFLLMGRSNWLIPKKKTWETPRLINVKHK